MKKTNYKILLFNNSKGSMREIFLSKSFIFIPISIFSIFNFLLFHFFSDSYVSWRSGNEIQNHKENNKLLVQNIQIAENKIANI